MNKAHRTLAAEKAPEDFAPIPLRPVDKKVCALQIKRKDGRVETMPFILRPGDVASIDGVTVKGF